MLNKLLEELRQFIPSERIYTDELRTLGWGTDASFYRQIPKAVIRSDNEEKSQRSSRLARSITFLLHFVQREHLCQDRVVRTAY